MKRLYKILIVCGVLLIALTAYSKTRRWLEVGSFQGRIADSGNQTVEGKGGGGSGYYYFNNFLQRVFYTSGWHMAATNWVDENGETWQIRMAGAGHVGADETVNIYPLPDEEGITIRRVFRYQPPTIVVDGMPLHDRFPLEGDIVDPAQIPGTADVMVESRFNTRLGITVHQRVLGWSQKHHDDYHLYEWTFTNTGNIDYDEEVELPDQTITDFYFAHEPHYGWHNSPAFWSSYYGVFPEDSLRMSYFYSARTPGSDIDNMGDPDLQDGFLHEAKSGSHAFLYVQSSPDDESNDPAQPQMTGYLMQGHTWLKRSVQDYTADERQTLYNVMTGGTDEFYSTSTMHPSPPALTPNHEIPPDQKGLEFVPEIPWFNARITNMRTIGPYDLEPGESITIAWAKTMGSLSPQQAFSVGKAWLDGNAAATWTGDYKLPPMYDDYPELAPADNDKAKDSWVYSSVDTLFRNVSNAQWNFDHNYNVPIPPPPPSIEVTSFPNRINIQWDSRAEDADDFAGYRVYRAQGNAGPTISEGKLIGEWERIFECGEGTGNPVTNSYDDAAAERGQAYYYYVTAFDNADGNSVGVTGQKESLESGRYLNMTSQAAHLTRPPGETLSDVRVVPNPFNINAAELQFVGEPYKIIFMNLPPECTITIYSESGDIVKTIEHTDGSGDEPWGDLENEHMISSSGQRVVSGLYFAKVETPDGETTIVKFVIVR